MIKRLFPVAVFLFASSVRADDLVAKVINAYGGAAAWSKVISFRETGTVTPAMRPGQGTLTRQWQRPDKLRVEIVYLTNTEVRIVDGDHGTQNGKEATGMGLDAMRLQAARLAVPLLLVEKKSSLRAVGNTIEIPLKSPMTLTIEVDPESGHITKSTAFSECGGLPPLLEPAACCRRPRQAAARKAAPRRRTPKAKPA